MDWLGLARLEGPGSAVVVAHLLEHEGGEALVRHREPCPQGDHAGAVPRRWRGGHDVVEVVDTGLGMVVGGQGVNDV